MKILITGAKGFVGQNLVATLRTIQEGKNRTRPSLLIDEIFEYDVDTAPTLLSQYCAKADFVFHLAGVNRPKDPSAFMTGNFGFSSLLLETLKQQKNACPVMLSSSIQATLTGRYADSDYGKSKQMGEDLFFAYGKETGSSVLVYRFPNVFGKWCRPNYNSAVATFCHQMANGQPINVSDPNNLLTLVYIDDLVEEMLDALEGKAHRMADDRFCFVPTTHEATLGTIVSLLTSFQTQPQMLLMPDIAPDSFAKKLYSTYLSYLPKEGVCFDLKMNVDDRGSFTELIKTLRCGQVSINVSKPGITKGEHWHHSKWEFFIVVSGEGLIEQRKIGTDDVLSFRVSGDKMQAVHMLPGYTHNIINLSDTNDLVTVMWANESFDPNHPDTFFEKVSI